MIENRFENQFIQFFDNDADAESCHVAHYVKGRDMSFWSPRIGPLHRESSYYLYVNGEPRGQGKAYGSTKITDDLIGNAKEGDCMYLRHAYSVHDGDADTLPMDDLTNEEIGYQPQWFLCGLKKVVRLSGFKENEDVNIRIKRLSVNWAENFGTNMVVCFKIGTMKMWRDSTGKEVNLTVENWNAHADANGEVEFTIYACCDTQDEREYYGNAVYEYEFLVESSNITRSNNICYHEKADGLSFVEYGCNEPEFGLRDGITQAWIPLLISKPQYSQSDKTYTKQDGSIVTLYSQARKEWEGETEYLPECLHDKIMVALMCDEVYINGMRVTKSGSYDVDWDSHDTLCDGTKIAKASFKVQSNMVSRNSNY